MDGVEVKAHIPNTGRLRELLPPGAEVMLSRHDEPHRKTGFELRMIKKDGVWVSIDSQLPNKVVEEGLLSGMISDFGCVTALRREVTHGSSRFDFYIEAEQPWFIEVKGVTLVEGNWSYFPDAPTERGARHVRELTAFVADGGAAGVIFLVQHPRAQGFTPNWKMDPAFSHAVAEAEKAGVKLVAWKCSVDTESVVLQERVPVIVGRSDNENAVHP